MLQPIATPDVDDLPDELREVTADSAFSGMFLAFESVLSANFVTPFALALCCS